MTTRSALTEIQVEDLHDFGRQEYSATAYGHRQYERDMEQMAFVAMEHYDLKCPEEWDDDDFSQEVQNVIREGYYIEWLRMRGFQVRKRGEGV